MPSIVMSKGNRDLWTESIDRVMNIKAVSAADTSILKRMRQSLRAAKYSQR